MKKLCLFMFLGVFGAANTWANDVSYTYLTFPVVQENGKFMIGLKSNGGALFPFHGEVPVNQTTRSAVKESVPSATRIEPLYHLEIIDPKQNHKSIVDSFVVLTEARIAGFTYLEAGNSAAFYPENHKGEAFIPVNEHFCEMVYVAQFLIHEYTHYCQGSLKYDDQKFSDFLRSLGEPEHVSGRVVLRPEVVIPMLECAVRRAAALQAIDRCILF